MELFNHNSNGSTEDNLKYVAGSVARKYKSKYPYLEDEIECPVEKKDDWIFGYPTFQKVVKC